MANNQSRRPPQNSKRSSSSSRKETRRPANQAKKKSGGGASSIVSDPKILLGLGAVIIIGIILIAVLGKKKDTTLQVADVPSVEKTLSIETSSLAEAVAPVSADNSAPAEDLSEMITSEEVPAEVSKSVNSMETSELLSSKELASTTSKGEAIAAKADKKSSSQSDGKPFSLSPQTQYAFTGASLQQQLKTSKELTEENAALLAKQYEGEQIPVIITANVDGNQETISLQSRIKAAQAYNDETIGWIRIKDTAINFAVVQNKGSNFYYQSLGYDKKYSHHVWGSGVRKYGDYGVVWAGFDGNLSSREELSDNIVLFGHNWENISATPRMSSPTDVMFEHIAGYAHTEYAQANPMINFSIDGEDMEWVIVSAFYTEDMWSEHSKTLNFEYFQSDFTDDQKALFISEIQSRSEFSTDDELTIDDHFLTMSTCTRAKGSREDQRFVVVARLVREGEEFPELTYTDNPSIKAPVFN